MNKISFVDRDKRIDPSRDTGNPASCLLFLPGGFSKKILGL